MKTLTSLQLVILAELNRPDDTARSPYDIMININHICRMCEHAYSPGAFYPALSRLEAAGLTIISQAGCSLSDSGRARLSGALLQDPLPGSLLGLLYRLLVTSLIPPSDLRLNAIRRVQVYMINFSQITEDDALLVSDVGAGYSAINLARQHLGVALGKLAIDLVANK